MTADEKITEVMELVEEYKDCALGGFSAWEERLNIESKLRQIIKGNTLTALTVNLKVEDIEPLKGLIDLLRQHQDQLPKEIAEYCLKNFGGEE